MVLIIPAALLLGEAQAQPGKTERDQQRDEPLARQRAIAQSQLDNDVEANLAAQAAVKSAEAAVETAQLNLGFTKVTSLIDGVAAIATAQIGDLVGPATLLTTVSQLDPIKAYFPLSEQEYLQVADRINSRSTSKAPWQDGGLTLILSEGSVYPRTGAFLAADREIDAKTGTIRISATFPNPQRTLRPGQYGRVRAQTHERSDALLVPQRAVNELQGSDPNIDHEGGATSYLEVLDADTRLFDAELGLAQAELSELSALVEIYRALGGGWQT